MYISAATPMNQVAWRQVAEQKYQKLMDNLQVEERRQRVEQLNSTLYIAKSGKVEIQNTKAPNNINFLV